MNSKAEFNWVLQLLTKRSDFLYGKDNELGELYRLCDSPNQRDLVSSLLERFFFVDGKQYGSLLRDMAVFIKNLNYNFDELAIFGFVQREEIDSSLEVLQCLKVPLEMEFQKSVKIVPHFNLIKNEYAKGIRHFVAVDEFMGSGDTVINRFKKFQSFKFYDATIDFCVLTGMKAAVDRLISAGVPIKVFKILDKGISDFYKTPELQTNQADMISLESKLAEKIGNWNLSNVSFGYNSAESLYFKENGNVPNNVFPIFWWKKYASGASRIPLFTRVQDGY